MIQNKYRFLLAIFLVFASILLVVEQGLAKPTDPFIGAWALLDPDGSTTKLAIGGSGDPYRLTVTDNFASTCPSNGPFVGKGLGDVDDFTMTADMIGKCPRDKLTFPFQFVVEYDAATDTLVQRVGDLTLVYERRGNR